MIEIHRLYIQGEFTVIHLISITGQSNGRGRRRKEFHGQEEGETNPSLTSIASVFANI
jgi:hypothetical protein